MKAIGTVVSQYKGLPVYPKGTSVNVRSTPTTTATILAVVKSGTSAGTATGNVLKMTDGDWYQVSLPNKPQTYGYVRNDVAELAQPVSDSDAKSIVDNLVNSDREIFETLIRVGILISGVQAKGIDTTSYKQQYDQLSNNLNDRQNDIKSSTVLKWQAGLSKVYQDLIKNMPSSTQILNSTPIGFLPQAIVVGAVIGVGLSITAYYIFKPKYTKSLQDLKVSKNLEKALSSVDPDTATKIKKDLAGQIDKAYNQGKTDQAFGDLWKVGKYVVLFGAGFLLVTKVIMPMANKRKSNGK